ncbi:MAG: acyl transferase [Bacteroidetes bacterium]|nr:acyl transferase [Bacteroidota bacterium]
MINKIFQISSPDEFNQNALNVFEYQYNNNSLYQTFCNNLKRNPKSVNKIEDIPFMPISFFKNHKIICEGKNEEIVFLSSGTTGANTSKHFVTDLEIYEKSFSEGFKHFYGNIQDYCILALLPSYLEREGSSLVHMVNNLIEKSRHKDSGFYLHNIKELSNKLLELQSDKQKTLLIGVSFALLEMAKSHTVSIPDAIIMETGGMKGRGKELVRKELHDILCKGFGVEKIHSEYGMTELLSQAYSKGDGLFECTPWMKVMIRDVYDPLNILPSKASGAINIIDLANINSCSFIATDDLGKVYKDGSFEVTGRMDASDVRGCNTMI